MAPVGRRRTFRIGQRLLRRALTATSRVLVWSVGWLVSFFPLNPRFSISCFLYRYFLPPPLCPLCKPSAGAAGPLAGLHPPPPPSPLPPCSDPAHITSECNQLKEVAAAVLAATAAHGGEELCRRGSGRGAGVAAHRCGRQQGGKRPGGARPRERRRRRGGCSCASYLQALLQGANRQP